MGAAPATLTIIQQPEPGGTVGAAEPSLGLTLGSSLGTTDTPTSLTGALPPVLREMPAEPLGNL